MENPCPVSAKDHKMLIAVIGKISAFLLFCLIIHMYVLLISGLESVTLHASDSGKYSPRAATPYGGKHRKAWE